MDEDRLIEILTKCFCENDRKHIGDDCAVLPGSHRKMSFLFKTDAVVEGVHFTKRTTARLIGRKALARTLSDIAAMGGQPLAALITMGIPATMPIKRMRNVYSGMAQLARQYHVALVGGETTRCKDFFLSIAMLGQVQGYPPILRSTTRIGDDIWVTGRLGNTLPRKHLYFTPRLSEGQWLAQHHIAHAMMDISDGLASDLPRLAKASNVGFELKLEHLPLASGANVKAALCDGEDYELLFTTAPGQSHKWIRSWPFKTKVTCIGKIVRRSAKTACVQGCRGFDHFKR